MLPRAGASSLTWTRSPAMTRRPLQYQATAAGSTTCSAASTRAASAASSSPAQTGTAACAMMGPTSTSGVTKWTVQPWMRTPSASARRCVCSPGYERQQRRVNVDHAPGVAADERGAQHAHEPGKHDQVRRAGIDRARQRGIECVARCVAPMRDDPGGDAVRRGDGNATRIRAIRDDRIHDAVQRAGVHRGQQRGEVRATARDEYGDALGHPQVY